MFSTPYLRDSALSFFVSLDTSAVTTEFERACAKAGNTAIWEMYPKPTTAYRIFPFVLFFCFCVSFRGFLFITSHARYSKSALQLSFTTPLRIVLPTAMGWNGCVVRRICLQRWLLLVRRP